MTSRKNQGSSDPDADEKERFAFVGVAFFVGLAVLTVPMAFNGYTALQGARSDGSSAVMVGWLVYWCLVPFPVIFALSSVFGVFKLMFTIDSRHFPSIPTQLVLSAVLLYGAYRIGH